MSKIFRSNSTSYILIMKKIHFALFCIMALFSACTNLSDNEIEEMVSTGVVLVQNQSYYEVVLSNGEKLYFTGFDKDGDIEGLEFDEDSVKVATSYGTGFFVSNEGQIATNAHVVSNMQADKEVNKSISKVLDGIKTLVALAYKNLQEEYEEAVDAYNYANYSDDVSYETFYRIKAYKEELEEKLRNYRQSYNEIDNIKASDSDVKYHNEISIAYNNTFVTNAKDFVSCVVTKTDPDHDLAIVQLKNKKTPEDKYIFEVPEEDPLEVYTFMEDITTSTDEDKNSRLYMTSFNLGPALALTDEGVKSQFNSGTISQRTDARLMYSIPTLPGSSGSPVVNRMAQLVAINYAGLNDTQNFNYGIRVKYLRNLLEK